MLDDRSTAGELPTATDVQWAAERVRAFAHRTPVLRSRTLDDLVGGELFLKMESFQLGGSFKIRGAYNKVASLSAAELGRGVVASSSGNHAQAVAIAGRAFGAAATIVMPLDAAPAKLEATRSYGATIVFCDREVEDLEERAVRLAADNGSPLVHPFDDPLVIAGQGTAALELFEEAPDLDVLLVPVGGGGLVSGSALAAAAVSPRTRVIGVEPTQADDTRRSLLAGERVRLPRPRSIADGQLVPSPGVLPFALMQDHVEDVLLVADDDIVDAMRILFERLKVVVEPSGATGLAAALAHSSRFAGKRIGIIISGGNVSAHRFCELIHGRPEAADE